MDAAWSSRCGVTTDERAEPDNADEIQTEVLQGPEQKAAGPSREAAAGRAGARDEGARALRRILQLEPPGVRRRPLELLLPHGGPGHRRHGAREGVPVRVAGGPLPLAREPGAAAAVPDAGQVRPARAVRRGDRIRSPRFPAARPPVHQVQGEGGRWQTALNAGSSGGRRSRAWWPTASP